MLAVLVALGTYVGGPGGSKPEKWPKPEQEGDQDRDQAGKWPFLEREQDLKRVLETRQAGKWAFLEREQDPKTPGPDRTAEAWQGRHKKCFSWGTSHPAWPQKGLIGSSPFNTNA